MYTMKEACQILGVNYQTLKYYCNEGLVPHLKRDKNNNRIFDEDNISWIKGVLCLRKCGMSIKDIKKYLNLCLEGEKSIPERQIMLEDTRKELLSKLEEINDCINYIDYKQNYYQEILDHKREYKSFVYKK